MLTVLVVGLLGATPGSCRAAYQEVRYPEAARECRAALATAAMAELPELYRLLGLSLSASGDHAGAQAAFVSLLTLDPAASLPGDYSPKLRADFDAARERGAGNSVKLELRAPEKPTVGVALELEVSLDDGRAKPVTELSVKTPDGVQTLARDAARVTLPAASAPGPYEVTVLALDTFGTALGSRKTTLEVREIYRRPLLLKWPVWLGAAAVAGAAGGGLGLASRLTAPQIQKAMWADEQYAAQQAANAYAISADVLFAVAGALAITALVLFLTD